jgi:hypothetical protein
MKTACMPLVTAAGLNAEESIEISDINYPYTRTDDLEPTQTPSSEDDSQWLTLGPVLVASGTEKLPKAAGSNTKANAVGKSIVGSSMGLVLAVSAVMLLT